MRDHWLLGLLDSRLLPVTRPALLALRRVRILKVLTRATEVAPVAENSLPTSLTVPRLLRKPEVP
jgi:hypothetical protein